MLAELRPVFAAVPANTAMHMELTRLVSGRLGLSENMAAGLFAARGGGSDARDDGGDAQRQAPRRAVPRVLSAREQMERAFLAQCIAAPEAGRRALGGLDADSLFTGALLRRAAAQLAGGNLAEPLSGIDQDDGELVGLLAELVVEAGRWQLSAGASQTATLEVQRLQLELAGIDRRIHAARAQASGEVTDLARLRAEVKLRFDRAQERALAETGG
jgi:hypothetical protein